MITINLSKKFLVIFIVVGLLSVFSDASDASEISCQMIYNGDIYGITEVVDSDAGNLDSTPELDYETIDDETIMWNGISNLVNSIFN